jgi:hypothetical protein
MRSGIAADTVTTSFSCCPAGVAPWMGTTKRYTDDDDDDDTCDDDDDPLATRSTCSSVT